MSYDIHLQRYENGEEADVASDRVWNVLLKAWDAPPDHNAYTHVSWRGGEADLYAVPFGDPIDSLMFSGPSGGVGIFDLIVTVAREGDMVILAPGVRPCIVREEQRGHLPADFAAPVLVASGRNLLSLIEAAD